MGRSASDRVTRLLALVGFLVLVWLGSAAHAERPELILPPDLPRDDALRLRQLTARASVAGRVSGETFRLPAGVFEYLLDHPEFASQVARALRIGAYRVWREPDGLWLDDGGGAVGRLSIVYAGAGNRVAHVRGRYTRWYVPIRGEAVAVLAYASRPTVDGKTLITPTLTGFVKLDNVVVDAMAKLLPGTATAKAEQLARRLVRDFAAAAQAIDQDPARVVDELRRRPEIAPRDLDGFIRLVDRRRTSGLVGTGGPEMARLISKGAAKGPP